MLETNFNPEPLNLSELIQVDFPHNRYFREETPKDQIVIHHTVSGPYAQGNINWWISQPQRIATHFIIQGDGKIYQLYSSKFWAHHLGIKSSFLKDMGFKDYSSRNETLNKRSIGIEICNWGPLLKTNGIYNPALWDKNKYVPHSRVIINENNVQYYDSPFRGFNYYEKYTNEQIISVNRLLVYLCDKFNINKTYFPEMWDISKDALGGKNGIWTHCSYRADKSDIHPQPDMVKMLKLL